MNRMILIVAGVSSASSPLLVDSAVKGTAILVVAAVAAMILRRDSAATRHLVWLLAIVALLVVPVLSAMLPQWRVLPEWAGISPEPAVRRRRARPQSPGPRMVPLALPRNAEPVEVERPTATANPTCRRTAGFTARAGGTGNHSRVGRLELELDRALPLVWAIGFSVLIAAADGRSMDALEFRTASDGHLVVKATARAAMIPS